MVKREQEMLSKKKRIAEQAATFLKPYFSSIQAQFPKMEFFEGQRAVERMLYNNLPAWEESIEADDKTLWGYQDHSFVEQYLPWLRHHWERLSERWPSHKVRLFSNTAEVEESLSNKVENRQIRVISELPEFSSSVWMMGGYLVLLQTRQLPHYAVQLKDRAFAANIKAFITLLWRTTSG